MLKLEAMLMICTTKRFKIKPNQQSFVVPFPAPPTPPIPCPQTYWRALSRQLKETLTSLSTVTNLGTETCVLNKKDLPWSYKCNNQLGGSAWSLNLGVCSGGGVGRGLGVGRRRERTQPFLVNQKQSKLKYALSLKVINHI